MFLRKLVVIVLPLLMAALLCLVLPLMGGVAFWTEVFQGLTLGVFLALLLPLCGAIRKREPFAHLLWVPLMLLIVTLLAQYLWVINIRIPVLEMLHTEDATTILVESLFIGFMTVQLIRTKK